MNIRDVLTKGKALIAKIQNAITKALKSLEGKITDGTDKLIPWVSAMVDDIQKAAFEVDTELPVITAELTGPVGTAIAAAIPGGVTLKAETLAVITRFQPYIQNAADKDVMNALKLRLTAQIIFIEHGAIATIDKALLDVQNFFQALDEALDIPTELLTKTAN